MFTAVEIEKLYKEGKIKEGDQLIRIWESGHKSLGILESNMGEMVNWKALEDYNVDVGCTKGESYGLGKYIYTNKMLERKRKLKKLNNYEK